MVTANRQREWLSEDDRKEIEGEGGSKERHGRMKLNDEMKRDALRANKENSLTFLRVWSCLLTCVSIIYV